MSTGWSWGPEVSSQVCHWLGGRLSQTPSVSLDMCPQHISSFSDRAVSCGSVLRDSLKFLLLWLGGSGRHQAWGQGGGRCGKILVAHTRPKLTSCLLSILPHSCFPGSQINHLHPCTCSQENPSEDTCVFSSLGLSLPTYKV